MLNTPLRTIPQGYQPMQTVAPQPQNVQQKPDEQQKVYANEQGMAITYDIAAEYSAIGKMNNIIADVAKELKTEKDPVRIKLLEARINTLNNMILQRELRLNQMEQTLNSVNKYCQA